MVQVLDPIDKLMEESTSFVFFQSFLADYVVEEFAVFHVLHDKHKRIRGFNYLVKLHDAGMPDYFEDVNFP